MSDCFGFLVFLPEDWIKSFSLVLSRLQSWSQSISSPEVRLFYSVNSSNASARAYLQKNITVSCMNGSRSLLERCGIYVVKKGKRHRSGAENSSKYSVTRKDSKIQEKKSAAGHQPVMLENEQRSTDPSFPASLQKMSINGGNKTASLFTQKGMKDVNQDSMLLWEDFMLSDDTVFCGVFDGHGPHGHFVSRSVRDVLPVKLVSCWKALVTQYVLESCKCDKENKKTTILDSNAAGDLDLISAWKKSFQKAYKMVDRELLINNDFDCVFSGTTAVSLVKQGKDLIIANVGDSRAVLGVKSPQSDLSALQLTVDLTPNLPEEAERIIQRNGRVFALPKEPLVKRAWLPHDDVPGLAMSRALGDHSLKNFGIISVPEITYRQITTDDKFVVLATDGVWNVLSNEEVVQIVDATSLRSLAAKAVVNAAVQLWKQKLPYAKVDDCAAVCLFLDGSE